MNARTASSSSSAPLPRRVLLQSLAAAAAGGWSGAHAAPTSAALTERHLLMFSLFGGNDGLNTVVPYRDPLYRRLRPTLSLGGRRLLPLNHELALNPALARLHRLYEAGEVAVLLDVGNPQPNLSHFDSTAIWDCADLAGMRARTGWFAQLAQDNPAAFASAGLDFTALSFAPGDRFAVGEGVSQLSLHNLRQFLAASSEPAAVAPPGGGSEMERYLLTLDHEARQARQRLAVRLRDRALPDWDHYEEPLAVQVKTAGWLLAQGVRVPALKLVQPGYDTHTDQIATHRRQLHAFDQALGLLVGQLQAQGRWAQTMIIVYSEFGRRAAENASGGTDHGTAGPAFVIGGAVRGGIVGQRADLARLDADGNLVAGLDFRRIYATAAGPWLGMPVNRFEAAGHAPLPVLRA